MALSGSQSDLEQRFGHLIQPIRDLTKNWDINICSYLEDYLDELEKIQVTFDDGHTTMNFAEAALLIQGSACVYSKKVEYLYTLVYQVLDLLANKKNSQKPSSVDKDGNDNDANFPHDEDEEFLSLDDIKEHKNVDMKEGAHILDRSIAPIPKTPLALIPLEDGEKGQNPLLSKTGEVLASRNDFKMNTSYVHPCGSMLLDMTHLNLLELSLKLLASSTPYPTKPGAAKLTEECNGNVEMQAEGAGDVPNDGGEDMPMNMSVDFDDNDGGDALGASFNADPLAPPEEGEGLRRSERRRVQIVEPVAPPKPTVDPWLSTDPYDEDKNKAKALSKTRKSVRIPIKSGDTTKKRKRKMPVKETTLEPLVCRENFRDSGQRKIRDQLSEFEALYWEEFTKRKASEKEERKMMALAGYHTEEEDEVVPEEEGPELMAPGDGDDDDVEPLHVDDDLAFPGGEQFHHRNSIALNDSMFDNDAMVTSYEVLVRKHVEAFMASAQEYAQITELSKRVADWEEKIVPRLREEEQHEPFDIHKYGTSVMDNLSKTQTIPFKRIAAGKPEFEICRLFLATLQLANVGNLEISCQGTLHEGMDKMALQLISTKRHFEELAEYQAPSAK
ncbi:condensin-2 complex subunit H2-like [Haliotis rufescens]|uniref:condensin-2 complex subunit H2-like n=1 Tax=Haliotis rufescens TaxID=6454 RepID=UPI00201F325C|nr:condensin-2 complex subunit H2-like [Haliotis rufescens]